MSFINAKPVICKILSAMLIGLALSIGMGQNLARTEDRTEGTILSLERDKTEGIATFGKLYINGVFECYTLENSRTLIPAGHYALKKDFAGVLLVSGVPNRTKIEIHAGNQAWESKGCILLGLTRANLSLQYSRKALAHLNASISFPCVLVVRNAQPPSLLDVSAPLPDSLETLFDVHVSEPSVAVPVS